MTLQVQDLIDEGTYFVAEPSVVLRATKTGSGGVNHLLMGDWLEYQGKHHVKKWKTDSGSERSKTYVKVKCRGDQGWLELDEITDERALEVNFVDIGQGDGCHIVTPDDDVLLIDAGDRKSVV